jgi:hypothetical protein
MRYELSIPDPGIQVLSVAILIFVNLDRRAQQGK